MALNLTGNGVHCIDSKFFGMQDFNYYWVRELLILINGILFPQLRNYLLC